MSSELPRSSSISNLPPTFDRIPDPVPTISQTHSMSQGAEADTILIPDVSAPGPAESRVACTWPSCSQTFSRDYERDRHYRTVHVNNGDRPYKCLVAGCQAHITSWTRAEKLKSHNKIWHGPYHCQVLGCTRRFPHGFGSQMDLNDHARAFHHNDLESSALSTPNLFATLQPAISEVGSAFNNSLDTIISIREPTDFIPCSPTVTTQVVFNANLQQAKKSSNRPPQPEGGFPSAWRKWQWNDLYENEYRHRKVALDGTENDWEYEYRNSETPQRQETNHSTVTKALNSISKSTAPLNMSPVDDSGAQNLTKSIFQSGLATGGQKYGEYSQEKEMGTRFVQASNTSNLDPSFVIHRSREFKFGRVFKVLWSEPIGGTGTELTGLRQARYGEPAYHSIRRFLIVDPRKGHCICLPILTYGGQATLKKGVHPEDHAVIYTTKNGVMLPGERITKRAIRMIPTSEDHKLDPASRINYSKVYTVEHNVKVSFVGHIAPKYEQQVVTDYNNTHRVLPDRSNSTQTSDELYEHVQGVDPQYSSFSSYSTISSSTGPAYGPRGRGSYLFQPDSYPSSTTTSNPYYVPQYSMISEHHGDDHNIFPSQLEEAVEAAHIYDETLYDDN